MAAAGDRYAVEGEIGARSSSRSCQWQAGRLSVMNGIGHKRLGPLSLASRVRHHAAVVRCPAPPWWAPHFAELPRRLNCTRQPLASSAERRYTRPSSRRQSRLQDAPTGSLNARVAGGITFSETRPRARRRHGCQADSRNVKHASQLWPTQPPSSAAPAASRQTRTEIAEIGITAGQSAPGNHSGITDTGDCLQYPHNYSTWHRHSIRNACSTTRRSEARTHSPAGPGAGLLQAGRMKVARGSCRVWGSPQVWPRCRRRLMYASDFDREPDPGLERAKRRTCQEGARSERLKGG